MPAGHTANPFRPGNGIQPSYLAGRSEFLQTFERSLSGAEAGLPRNWVIYGLRGTGKTVLLGRFRLLSEPKWLTVEREFNERFQDEVQFAEAIAADITSKAVEVSLRKRIKESGKIVIDNLKPKELSAYGISYKPYYKTKRQLLEDYLKDILVKNWNVFERKTSGVVLLYDEFHTLRDRKDRNAFPLASFLGALSYAQRQGCRYFLCLSGLPIIKTHLKEAKTYTERMFEFKEVGNLSQTEAKNAIVNALKDSNYEFDSDLVDVIVSETNGYPYFIQFYGYFIIDRIGKQKINLRDFEKVKHELLRELDASFFEDRYALASEKEKRVLRAMAKSSEDLVQLRTIIKLSKINYFTIRELLARLIEKGLIFRSERAKYSFTIPLFKDYLLRN